MNLQIKIIRENTYQELQTKINSFLKVNDISDIIDIKVFYDGSNCVGVIIYNDIILGDKI